MNDTMYEERPSRVAKALSLIPKLLKLLFYLLVFGVFGALVVRIMIADYYPANMERLYPSAELIAAYEADPSLTVRRQDLRISYDDPHYSLFMASDQFYCPEIGEFQITVRYNNATLEEMQKDFALPDLPAADPSLFDFSLVDDNGNRTPLTCVATDSKFMYQYMKLCTSDLDFTTDPGWIRIEIYYAGAVDYAEEAYSMIPVYEKELVSGDEIVTLTKGDLQPW